MLVLGLVLAAFASLAINAGYLLQHLGGATAPMVSVRRPLRSIRSLLASPAWAAGTGSNLFGSVLHIGALAAAPLTLVQAFSAGGLALVVPVSARVVRTPVERADRARIALIVVALVMLAVSPSAASRAPASAGPPLVFLAVTLTAGAGLLVLRGSRHAGALAIVAGLLYGLSDAATKAFTQAAGSGLLAAVLTPWPAVVVALCAAAFFAFQRSLQLGSAATVIVLMTATLNVTAVAAGVAVFGESFGTRPGVAALHILAMATIAVASWRLAAAQARIGEQPRRPAPAPRRRAPIAAHEAA